MANLKKIITGTLIVGGSLATMHAGCNLDSLSKQFKQDVKNIECLTQDNYQAYKVSYKALEEKYKTPLNLVTGELIAGFLIATLGAGLSEYKKR